MPIIAVEEHLHDKKINRAVCNHKIEYLLYLLSYCIANLGSLVSATTSLQHVCLS